MIHLAEANHYDTIIIGGGVLGLWAARHAIRRGEKVALIEKRHIGAGASGGFLGALMPHMPDSWNAKKQYQFDGLSSLEAAVRVLEAETGIDCGYRQCGRIMPITNPKLKEQVERRIDGAKKNWRGKYEMSLQSCPEPMPDWINPEIAKFGVQSDTLAARINPRNYLSALEASICPLCTVVEGKGVAQIRIENGAIAVLENRDRLFAQKLIVANGYEAYPLLQPFMGEMNTGNPVGRGVKGQAVLLEHEHDDSLPIVYHDGAYVVPHPGNRVAIGSTSVNDWQGHEPDGFDNADMGFYERALELVPALRDAPIIERWAAVRPRNTLDGRGTEPWFGPVPGHDNLIALIGGFKITLGIAHLASNHSL